MDLFEQWETSRGQPAQVDDREGREGRFQQPAPQEQRQPAELVDGASPTPAANEEGSAALFSLRRTEWPIADRRQFAQSRSVCAVRVRAFASRAASSRVNFLRRRARVRAGRRGEQRVRRRNARVLCDSLAAGHYRNADRCGSPRAISRFAWFTCTACAARMCRVLSLAEIDISRRAEDSIHSLFMDPTGNHLFVCLQNGDNFYLHSRSPRPKKLSRWQGTVVESIAFDAIGGSESSTKSILVGSSRGQVFEACVESSGKDKLWTLVRRARAHGRAAA